LVQSPRTGNRSHRDDDDAPIKEGPVKKWNGLKTKRIEKVIFAERRKEFEQSAEFNAGFAMPMPATQPQSRFRLEHILHKEEKEKLEAAGVKFPANVLISKRQPRSPPLVGGRRPQVITIAEIRSRREARRALGATSRRGSTGHLVVGSSSTAEAAAEQNTPMAALLRCVQKCVDGAAGATPLTPAPGSPEQRAAVKGPEASLQSTSWAGYAQPPAAMKQPSSMTVVSEANWVPKASSAAAAPAEDETPIAALMRRIVSSAHSCLSGLTGAAALPSESVKKAFETFDRNGNGSLDADELRSALAYIGFNTSAAHTREMLARYDTSLRDGKLDLNEFARLVYDLNSAAQPPTFTKQTSSVVAQPPSAASASIASSAAATAALARPGSAEAFAAQQKAEAAKQPTRSAAEWDVQQKAAAEKEQAAKQELARVAAAAERRASQAAAADEKKEAEKAAAEKAAAERIAVEKAAAQRAAAEKAAVERAAAEKAAVQKAAAERAAAERAAAEKEAAEKAAAEKVAAEKAAAERLSKQQSTLTKQDLTNEQSSSPLKQDLTKEQSSSPLKQDLTKQPTTGAGLAAAKPATPAASTPIATAQPVAAEERKSVAAVPPEAGSGRGNALARARAAKATSSVGAMIASGISSAKRLVSGETTPISHAVAGAAPAGAAAGAAAKAPSQQNLAPAAGASTQASAAAKAPSQQNLAPAATASTQAHQLKKEPSAKHEERLATGQVPIVAGFQVAVKQDDPGDAAKAAGQEKAKAAAAAAKAAAEKAAAAQAAAQAARAKAAMMRSASVAAALQAGVPAAPAAPEGGSGAVGGSGAAAPSFAVGSRVYVKRSSGEESIGFITEYDRAKQVYTLELDQRGSGKVKQCVEKDLRPAPENAAHAEPAGADIPVQHRTRHRVNFEPGPLGMGLEMSTDGWVMVSDVKEGQAAAQHGVLKGSYILEVNGEKCDGLVQADVTNLLRKAGAREVLFALPLRKK